jgi:hypothetical protein
MNLTLTALIEQLVDVKQKRTDIAAQDSDLSKQAAALEADIMHLMSEVGTTKAATESGHSVTMAKKTVPVINDWDAFYGYVQETKSFDLLHKRLSTTAFKDRAENGEQIPGSTITELWGITLTKSRK